MNAAHSIHMRGTLYTQIEYELRTKWPPSDGLRGAHMRWRMLARLFDRSEMRMLHERWPEAQLVEAS